MIHEKLMPRSVESTKVSINNILATGSTGVYCCFKDVDDVGMSSEMDYISLTSSVDESEPCSS